MDGGTYTYRENGRTPLKLLATVVSLALTAFVLSQPEPVPWYVVLPLGLYVVMTLWMVIANETHGMDVSGDAITLVDPNAGRRYAAVDIAAVHVEAWSDSTDISLRLRDGTVVRIHPGGHPTSRILTRELRARGYTLADTSPRAAAEGA